MTRINVSRLIARFDAPKPVAPAPVVRKKIHVAQEPKRTTAMLAPVKRRGAPKARSERTKPRWSAAKRRLEQRRKQSWQKPVKQQNSYTKPRVVQCRVKR